MSNVARQIVQTAQQLRAQDPGRYGTKGAAKGTSGYIPGGWREAVRAATQMYYQQTGKTPSLATQKRKQLGTIAHRLRGNPEQDALYRGYKRQLEELKMRYWQAGLHIRAVQPRKPKAPRPLGERLRLPPIVL